MCATSFDEPCLDLLAYDINGAVEVEVPASPVPIYAGAAVGGICVIALCIGAFVFWRRRQYSDWDGSEPMKNKNTEDAPFKCPHW